MGGVENMCDEMWGKAGGVPNQGKGTARAKVLGMWESWTLSLGMS